MFRSKLKILLCDQESKFNYFDDLLPVIPLEKLPSQDSKAMDKENNHLLLSAKVRIEKKGRGGKTVTVLYSCKFHGSLQIICKNIKQSFGIGGWVKDNNLEFNGDVRQKLDNYLKTKFNTKLKGSLQ